MGHHWSLYECFFFWPLLWAWFRASIFLGTSLWSSSFFGSSFFNIFLGSSLDQAIFLGSSLGCHIFFRSSLGKTRILFWSLLLERALIWLFFCFLGSLCSWWPRALRQNVPLIHVYELHLNTKPNAFWGPHPYGKCYFCTHATTPGRYATEGNTSTWVKIFWALPGLFEPAFCLPSQKFASHSHFQTSRCKLGKFWHHQLTTCNLVSGRRLLSFFSAFSSFSVSALSTSSSCWWLTFCP